MKVIAFLLLLTAPAIAGEVVLKNGSVFQGKVIEEGDTIELELEFGTMTFRRTEVREVRPGKSALEVLREQVAALKPTDAEGHFLAAVWAEENSLPLSARRLMEATVEIDPDHAAARTRLGFHRYEGKWLTEPEFLKAQGLVHFRGAWLRPNEVNDILAREEEDRAHAAAADRADEIASLKKRLAEAEAAVRAAKEEAARAAADCERYKADTESARVVIVCRTCNQPRRCACMPQGK